MWIRIILVAWIRIPIRINKLNPNPHPDPHQSDKLDPDPDPHHIEDDKPKMSEYEPLLALSPRGGQTP